MFNLGGIDPFSWGSSLPTFNLNPASLPGGSLGTWGGTTASGSTNQSGTLAQIFAGARGILNDVFSYKIQQNQVNHGQTPSIGTDPSGRPSGQLQAFGSGGSLGAWLPLLMVVAVVGGLLYLIFGRH